MLLSCPLLDPGHRAGGRARAPPKPLHETVAWADTGMQACTRASPIILGKRSALHTSPIPN
jgi:hypothetical protein